MPTNETDANDLLTVALVDIQKAGRRAANAKHLEAARELGDNGYPCMETLARAMMAKFAEVDEVIDELLSNEGSVIQPDLAAQIFATLELAKDLCGSLSVQSAVQLSEDITKKIEILLAAVAALEPEIAEVAVEIGTETVEGEEIESDDDVAEVA